MQYKTTYQTGSDDVICSTINSAKNLQIITKSWLKFGSDTQPTSTKAPQVLSQYGKCSGGHVVRRLKFTPKWRRLKGFHIRSRVSYYQRHKHDRMRNGILCRKLFWATVGITRTKIECCWSTLGLFMLRSFKYQPDEVINISNC